MAEDHLVAAPVAPPPTNLPHQSDHHHHQDLHHYHRLHKSQFKTIGVRTRKFFSFLLLILEEILCTKVSLTQLNNLLYPKMTSMHYHGMARARLKKDKFWSILNDTKMGSKLLKS